MTDDDQRAARALAILEAQEWNERNPDGSKMSAQACPACWMWRDGTRHASNCWLAQALDVLRGEGDHER